MIIVGQGAIREADGEAVLAHAMRICEAGDCKLLVVDREFADTALWLAALEVARSLVDVNTPASAKAALAKQLEASLAAATKGAKVAANPVDDIRARRDAKRVHG